MNMKIQTEQSQIASESKKQRIKISFYLFSKSVGEEKRKEVFKFKSIKKVNFMRVK